MTSGHFFAQGLAVACSGGLYRFAWKFGDERLLLAHDVEVEGVQIIDGMRFAPWENVRKAAQ